ncbi:class I tRNA ligase family protein [Candidatus Gracilibacteria bacterium]|nr:class I tRNA ligase family protein [Candidatus Gracilibacteria bacterium]
MNPMEKNYDHNASENKISASWEASGAMKADNKSKKKKFTISLPPPNVTGELHLGHAAMLAIEDIMIRFKKMTGHEVLWLPGTDHAAIATENVVLKHLGLKSREEMQRNEFLKECRKFATAKHDRIVHQIKKMGAWLDWSREAYTFDEPRNQAVNTIFKRLYDDGLISRGHRMINWSVGAQSVLSDEEVVYKEVKGALYHYKYFFVDSEEFLEVVTTRPETMFGDTAVALNPHDPRAKKLHGKKVKVPFSGREIPIILDDHVDLEFGTATLKVTPAHDPNDFEIGEKHNLEKIQVIGFDGHMETNDHVPKKFQKLSSEECRKLLTKPSEWFIKKEEHLHNVGFCYRSHTVVEPMISPQWFILVDKEFETNKPQRFLFARHGETTSTKNRVVQGESDPLNIKGKADAKKLAEFLSRNKNVTRIISSEHKRAKQTAEIIGRSLGIKIETWKEFNGADLGSVVGKKILPNKISFDMAIEAKTGETMKQIFDRVKKGWEKLKKETSEGDILVISHRSILSTLEIVRSGGDKNQVLEQRRQHESASFGYWGETTEISDKKEKTTLKKLTAEAVRSGDVKIIPKQFEKVYFHWIDNLRDWCISRQIWWGHRIPVWYDKEKNITAVGDIKTPHKDWTQDKDTLDTWFSSALWPFSTLGWPDEKAEDFQKFFPTDVLETGHDILFFWVARMIMFSKYATGKPPFHTVYLHGLVTDEHGKKMSKSAGNGIDPLEVVEKFGADAVRLSLVVGTATGQPIPLGASKISGYRNFVNKLWNAGRFVKMQTPTSKKPEPKSLADKWIASRFTKISKEIKNHLDKYEISMAGDKIYHFVWDDFCDWYIEESKKEPNPDFLYYLFNEILKLAHPLCPFITEKLWQELGNKDILIGESFPETNYVDKKAEDLFEKFQKEVIETRKAKTDKTAIEKEIKQLKKDISALEIRLKNKGYLKKAPAKLVEQTKKELKESKEKLQKLS